MKLSLTQILNENEKAKNILALVSDEELLFIMMRLYDWFKGAQMNYSDKKAWIFKRDKSFFENLRKLYPNEYKNQILYRFSAVDYDKKIKVGNSVKLRTANKPFQSWSTSKQSAIDFYKDIWEDRSKRKDKRFMQVIMSAKFTKDEILFSRDLVSKFCKDVTKLLPKIKALDKERFMQYKIIVKDCQKRVDSTFIRKQNEVIVNIPSERKNCKIEQIFENK